jgi:YVTN family beta-propeller protein
VLAGKTFLVLIAINVIVYLIQIAKGVDWSTPAVIDLLNWGGNAAPFTFAGESWRLFTSMFLHGGILHLALNMYMLLICGALAERAFGSIKFIVLYVISGLTGSLLSALWNGSHKSGGERLFGIEDHLQFIVSVGASGALMGLAAGYIVYRVANGHEVGEDATANTHHAILQVVAINIGMGFFIPGVDQACHIGGLLGGAAAGFALQLTPASERLDRWYVMPSVVIAASGLLFWLVLRQPPSEELQQLRAQVIAEIQEREQATGEAREQAAAANVAAQNKQQLDASVAAQQAKISIVDEQTAAGIVIPTSVSSEADMLLSRDERTVFVSSLRDNKVMQFDLSTGAVLKTIQAGNTRAKRKPTEGCSDNFCLGRGAAEMLLSPDERTLYVSSIREDHVGVVDLATSTVTATIPVGRFPRQLVGTADGTRAYVFNAVDNSVSMLDLAQAETVGEPRMLAGGPSQLTPYGRLFGMWLSPDEQQLHVADDIADQIETLDARTLAIISTAPLEHQFLAGGESGDKKKLAVLTPQAIYLYGLMPLRFQQRFDICTRLDSFNIALNNDGSLLAVSALDFRIVVLIHLAGRKVIGVYPTRARPMDLRFGNDDRRIYVKNGYDQSISILDITKSTDVTAFTERYGEMLCAAQ